ncbi:STAS domain-containing protein [Vibrio astriarenae]|uniref:Lipid asymmetry maintenance protein MlaB n=1 Tax=Vibrio agarivorans TaxID=153622 RepID=A0ABT7Y2B9_9VIBR|nr:lipid asymmetry maintenance protein MlaB [Vibrio agarivorans]MDN2482145.1 lipid asymmetry maintenance protein MlaB [Vibrio agarivorans]
MGIVSLEDDVIRFEGKLDRHTVPSLWQSLEVWKPSQNTCSIDLSGVKRVDSAGMVMLIHLIEHAKTENCHIMLSFVPKELGTLFRLSNVDKLLAKHIQN